MKRVKKLFCIVSVVLIMSMVFSINGFALEYINLYGEIDIVSEYESGNIIVGITDSGDGSTINGIKNKYNINNAELLLKSKAESENTNSIYKMSIDSSVNIASLCYDINKESNVLYAEPNYICYESSVETTSDSYTTENSNPWYVERLGVSEYNKYISENNIEPRPITIAVLDSGCDRTNPCVSSHIKTFTNNDGEICYGYDVTTETVGYDITDTHGHGTSVASAIVSSAYANRSASINQDNIKVLPIRIATIGNSGATTMVAIARAVGLLVKENPDVNVDIINISYGFNFKKYPESDYSDKFNTLKLAVDSATENNIIVFASAGNSNKTAYNQSGEYNYDFLSYPAAYSNVIGVMSSNSVDKLSDFSNFGQAKKRDENDNKGYDLIAPGEQIFNLYNYDLFNNNAGTSFSSPIAASVVACYLSLKPVDYLDNRDFSSIKSEIVNIFTPKSYTFIADDSTYTTTEQIPAVNLIDVIKAVDSDYIVTVDNSTNLTYSFSQNDTGMTMNIDCNGDMPNFSSMYSRPWGIASISDVTSVVISGTNVTHIGNYAFSGFASLESVTLPSSVTSIGTCAFSSCDSLKEIDLSSVKSIGGLSFNLCNAVLSVDISSAEYIGEFAFAECKELVNVTMPNNSFVLKEGGFYYCSSLNSANLQNVNTIPEYSFTNCFKLKNVTLPQKGNIRIDCFAFAYCDIGASDGSGLKEIVLTRAVKEVADGAFLSCSRMEKVYILNKNINIADKAFKYCRNLKIYCHEVSTAKTFAINKEMPYEILSDITPASGSTCVVDEENYFVFGLEYNLSIEQLLSSYLSVTGSYNIEYTSSNAVGTGMKINLLNYENIIETYTIVLFGDVNGDGSLDVTDLFEFSSILRNKDNLNPDSAYYMACDLVNYGDGLTEDDLNALSDAVAGYITLLQTPNYGGYNYENFD